MSYLQTTDYMWLPLRMNAVTCLSVEGWNFVTTPQTGSHVLSTQFFFYPYCAPVTLIFIVCVTKLQIEAITDQTVRIVSKLIIWMCHILLFLPSWTDRVSLSASSAHWPSNMPTYSVSAAKLYSNSQNFILNSSEEVYNDTVIDLLNVNLRRVAQERLLVELQ